MISHTAVATPLTSVLVLVIITVVIVINNNTFCCVCWSQTLIAIAVIDREGFFGGGEGRRSVLFGER